MRAHVSMYACVCAWCMHKPAHHPTILQLWHTRVAVDMYPSAHAYNKCISVHTCVYTRVYLHTSVSVHECWSACVYMFLSACVCTHVRSHVSAHKHVSLYMCLRTCVNPHMHVSACSGACFWILCIWGWASQSGGLFPIYLPSPGWALENPHKQCAPPPAPPFLLGTF